MRGSLKYALHGRRCSGCERCAPKLTIVCEDRDDDPFTASVHAYAPTEEAARRFVGANQSIGGSSWERDGVFVYAMPSVHVGCAAEWRAEGYAIDESQFSDDPIDSFMGLDESELAAELARLASQYGDEHGDEMQAHVRAELAKRADRVARADRDNDHEWK